MTEQRTITLLASEVAEMLEVTKQSSEAITKLQARMTEMVNERRDCAGLQDRVIDWVRTTFDEETQANTTERCLRFVEEAIELAQAVGVDRALVDAMADRVYGNPPGEVAKEVAGCGTTLMSIAGTLGVDLLKVTKDEIERLESPEMRERARRRQDEKRAQLLTADIPSVCKNWDG